MWRAELYQYFAESARKTLITSLLRTGRRLTMRGAVTGESYMLIVKRRRAIGKMQRYLRESKVGSHVLSVFSPHSFTFLARRQLLWLLPNMRFTLLQAAAVSLSAAQAVHAALAELGKTVSVNGIYYYAAPNAVSTVLLSAQQLVLAPKCTGDDSLIPFTVMEDKSPVFNTTVFDSIVKNYTAVDDVFNKEFLQSKCTGSPIQHRFHRG